MAKITIDTDKWITQAEKAENTPLKTKEGHVSVQYISKLIRLGKLVSWHIPELRTTLVER